MNMTNLHNNNNNDSNIENHHEKKIKMRYNQYLSNLILLNWVVENKSDDTESAPDEEQRKMCENVFVTVKSMCVLFF